MRRWRRCSKPRTPADNLRLGHRPDSATGSEEESAPFAGIDVVERQELEPDALDTRRSQILPAGGTEFPSNHRLLHG